MTIISLSLYSINRRIGSNFSPKMKTFPGRGACLISSAPSCILGGSQWWDSHGGVAWSKCCSVGTRTRLSQVVIGGSDVILVVAALIWPDGGDDRGAVIANDVLVNREEVKLLSSELVKVGGDGQPIASPWTLPSPHSTWHSAWPASMDIVDVPLALGRSDDGETRRPLRIGCKRREEISAMIRAGFGVLGGEGAGNGSFQCLLAPISYAGTISLFPRQR